MEAADDICYRIIDLEDGFRLGCVSFTETEELLTPLAFEAQARPSSGPYGDIDDKKRKVEYLRAKAINTLVLQAVSVFKKNLRPAHAGRI